MTNKDLIMELVNNLEVESKNAEIIAKILDCDICGKVCDVVEVKHGHWKTYTKLAHTAPPFTYKIIECSLCRNPVQKYWNFCPWCGADMRGGVDNG